VTVAPITSTVRGITSEVSVGHRNGLGQDCVVSCDNITTVRVEAVGETIGLLFDDPVDTPETIMEVILPGMTHRVGTKGQVVIPKDLRDELGIEPGDEVTFWRHGDHVAVRLAGRRRPLRGRFRGSPLTDELERERAADLAREATR